MEDKSRLAQKSILIGYDTIRMTLLYRTIYDHLHRDDSRNFVQGVPISF